MHYTSWDRSDRENPVLLAEAGPQVLARFQPRSADVEGDFWRLEVNELGASATLGDGRVFWLSGNLGRDKRLEASLDGRTFSFINESGGNWIVEDVESTKIAQFCSKNSGVRAAILEFEGERSRDARDLSPAEIVGLSWFARCILEGRTKMAAIPIIATLVLASLVAVAAVLI